MLVFQVPISDQLTFLDRDQTLWTRALAEHPGFSGKRIWRNSERETEILITVGWDDRESWKFFPPLLQKKMEEQFGPFSHPSEEIELWPDRNPFLGKTDQERPGNTVFFHDGTGALQLWIFQVPRDRQVQFKDLAWNLWLRKVSTQDGFQGKDLYQNPKRDEEVWVAIGWRDSDDWKRLPNAMFSAFHRHTSGMIADRWYLELIPIMGTARPA